MGGVTFLKLLINTLCLKRAVAGNLHAPIQIWFTLHIDSFSCAHPSCFSHALFGTCRTDSCCSAHTLPWCTRSLVDVTRQFMFVYTSLLVCTRALVDATLEATQGEILSQSPTDATQFWWRVHGSWLEKTSICPWVASWVVCKVIRESHAC